MTDDWIFTAIKAGVKSGQGRGNWGHAGRPGQVGGSASSGSIAVVARYLTTLDDGFAPGYKGGTVPDISPTDRVLVDDALIEASKVVPSVVDIQLGVAFNSRHHTDHDWGSTSLHRRTGERVLFVSGKNVQRAIDGGKYDIAKWTGMTEPVTYESLVKYVVSHELGHAWWNSRVTRATTTDNRGETKVNIKRSPELESWERFYNDKKPKISQYSHGSVREGFADAFANFVTGQQLDSTVEDWFMENVR